MIDEWKAIRSEVKTWRNIRTTSREVETPTTRRESTKCADTARRSLLPLSSSSSNAVFRYLCASSSFALPVHCHIAFHECESFERTWRRYRENGWSLLLLFHSWTRVLLDGGKRHCFREGKASFFLLLSLSLSVFKREAGETFVSC